MQISAKSDYALRALLELATADVAMTADTLALAQDLPPKYLGAVLNDLRRSGFITSHRGVDSGYRLARPARDINLADIIQALDGPLIQVRGLAPRALSYPRAAKHLPDTWASIASGLELALVSITLEDIASGAVPRWTLSSVSESPSVTVTT